MSLNILFQLLIPFVTLLFGGYILILAPQKEQQERTKLINQLLIPGSIVKTVSGLSGATVFITHSTVIIELANGQKIEILKQTIMEIRHDKLQ